MNLLPKDYTKQENIIAKCLDEFGLRYEQQSEFPPYTVDFYIPEILMVVEADGKYGHLAKRDVKRDAALGQRDNIEYILHVKDKTQERIKKTLWRALSKLEKPDESLQNQSRSSNLKTFG